MSHASVAALSAICALISLVVLVVGVVLTNLARSPPAAAAGMIVAAVGGVCFVISGLAWAFG